jgi:hypothetical protein
VVIRCAIICVPIIFLGLGIYLFPHLHLHSLQLPPHMANPIARGTIKINVGMVDVELELYHELA